MKALLYKDILTLRRQGLLLLLFIIGFGLFAYSEKMLLFFPMLFILVPIILLGILFGTDHVSKVDQYLVSTTLPRTSIVLSRYVFVWILAAVGAFIAFLLPYVAPQLDVPIPGFYMGVL